ncbi:hypothetical protein GQ457_02G032540 [Hibiscus cannabinus]
MGVRVVRHRTSLFRKNEEVLLSDCGNPEKNPSKVPAETQQFLLVILLILDGAVHWIGYQKRNNVVFTTAILGIYLSAEEFFEISLPESLIGLGPMVLSTIKYGESSIAVLKRNRANELWDLAELWVMKEYGVVGSWTKVLTSTLHRKWFPYILGFTKNGEVLVQLDYGKLASLDLNFQQIELHGVELTTKLISLEGKSSLIDFLVFATATGIIAQEITGDVRMTNTSADEAERGITIKSTGISLSTPG